MKISVNTSVRPLKAVIGIDGKSLFIPGEDNEMFFLKDNFITILKSLDHEFGRDIATLALVQGRTPIYEGDEITIKF